jgi:hypothetical protein
MGKQALKFQKTTLPQDQDRHLSRTLDSQPVRNIRNGARGLINKALTASKPSIVKGWVVCIKAFNQVI